MREFNTDERKTIVFINNAINRSKLPILFEAIIMRSCLSNKNLVINFDNETALLKVDIDYYKQGGSNVLAKEIRDFNKTIIKTINIIKTLEENGFIVSYLETEAIKSGTQEYGNLIYEADGKEKASIEAKIYDKATVKALIEYSRKSILGDEQLAKYVSRGFKTEEEKVRQVELFVAVSALVITTIIGIIDLVHSSHMVHLLEKIHHMFKCNC